MTDIPCTVDTIPGHIEARGEIWEHGAKLDCWYVKFVRGELTEAQREAVGFKGGPCAFRVLPKERVEVRE